MASYAPRFTAPGAVQHNSKSFFATLFDFSFTFFLAPKLIKFLYAAFVGLSVLLTIAFIAAAFNFNHALGIFVLLASPVVFIIWVIQFRVLLELTQVFFALEAHANQQLILLSSGLPASDVSPHPRI